MGAAGSRENETAALEFVDRMTSENGVTVFSKSFCPYCSLAKGVLDEAGVKYHVVELDLKNDVPTGADIQNALATTTGRRTVPNVFIKKDSIGGGTDVQTLFQSGKLTEMLHAAGVIDMTELIGNTPLVYLNKVTEGCHARIAVKCEFMEPCASVKDRIGLNMILDAENSGRLTKDSHIIEATSGNTGIGLAFVAAIRGYKLTVVMPDTMSLERRTLLKTLGCGVVLTPGEAGITGAFAKVEELLSKEPGKALTMGQFDNPANPQIHFETTGPEVWRDTDGAVDFFVAGVGSGGTLTGTGRYLKPKKATLKIIAVEPEESPVLSGGSRGSHMITGIGAGIVPNVLETDLIDEVVTANSSEAFAMTKRLAMEEGILVGPSSGAAVVASIKIAKRPENAGKLIVAVLPSFGERYLSTALFKEEREFAANLPTSEVP
ncbi:hypothetical protein BBJ29_000826 [Phytophthora kernoviae]|uniref:Cysteine synthase n=1 Tax=Phytophthora kernoviae TaxID=325452 RepID=A0A3F2S338_9STRA|nr:hypothetical protein BBJ29_000826 [Phytophthora kernoviae]RLN69153.1 hypothetical protein BBP00_00000542 [Phytophthora kernoviae]